MKITLKLSKPRNPFVAVTLQRMAGSHRLQGGARRQQAENALRREVAASAPTDRYKSGP